MLNSLLLLGCAAGIMQPLPGAHRGLAPGQPENTLTAYNHAIDIGVAIIELDLRTTADGRIVVMHDDTVDRTTDGHGAVAALTFAQIERLDAGGKAGAAFAGQKVPTYEDVLDLAAARPVRLLLDIKDGQSIDLAKVVALAKARGVADRIVLGLRRLEDVPRARAIDPAITTLAFAGQRSEVDAYIASGVDIVRLWSDWVEAEPGLPAAVKARKRQVWILVGQHQPADDKGLAALHGRLVCAGGDAVITDWPALVIGR